MRKFLTASMAVMALTLAVSLSSPVLADGTADPTVHEVYEAAKAGHLDQAQTMMDQVLRDHPASGKAHYVQAELFAKEGKTQQARSELSRAEELEPGLPHEDAKSVQALKSQLGMLPRSGQGSRVIGMNTAPAAAHFPWGMVLIFGGAILILWMVFRRRSPAPYASGAPVMGGGGPGYGGPGGYGSPGMGGGGIGSGIAGGLASGLAVGAGVVAGEELTRHFLDGDRREGVAPPVENNDWQQPSSNSDMGGSDFGVNDSGSWDDSGGGGGGGGDDWT